MDPELLQIMAQGHQMPDLRPLAEALAQQHVQMETEQQARQQRAEAEAQRRMQQIALDDPALLRMRRALEAPVQPFRPERPSSYAPGAAQDINTLGGAFSAPSGSPQGGGSSPGHVDVTMGDLTLDPSVDGAFSAPQTAADKVYETQVHGDRVRQPLVKRRIPAANVTRQQGSVQRPDQRPDLSPEGAAEYQKLAPSLVARRNNEESTRRALEQEQMRGDTSQRNAQLRSATDLVREHMRLVQQADMFRQKRMGAKSKDEALKWADQERDARLTAMNAAVHVVQQYQYALTDPNDPQMRSAMQAAQQAAQAYAQSENDFNQLRSERGMNPQGVKLQAPGAGPTPTGRTKTDKNGAVWEEMSDGSARKRS